MASSAATGGGVLSDRTHSYTPNMPRITKAQPIAASTKTVMNFRRWFLGSRGRSFIVGVAGWDIHSPGSSVGREVVPEAVDSHVES